MDHYLTSSRQSEVRGEGWRCILGKHFLSALSSRARGRCSLPKTQEYHDRYCHSYSRDNDRVGVLNFPHFGPREKILLKKSKALPWNDSKTVSFDVLFKNSHAGAATASASSSLMTSELHLACRSNLFVQSHWITNWISLTWTPTAFQYL